MCKVFLWPITQCDNVLCVQWCSYVHRRDVSGYRHPCSGLGTAIWPSILFQVGNLLTCHMHTWHWCPFATYSSFVHRCGRTARMGREGRALILLTPSEASYVEFLRLNMGLILQPYPTLHTPCVRDQARDLIVQEKLALPMVWISPRYLVLCLSRELHHLGLRAFVSFVRFYHKHECKLIFKARGRHNFHYWHIKASDTFIVHQLLTSWHMLVDLLFFIYQKCQN